jgi:signal transduction histidine kinase
MRSKKLLRQLKKSLDCEQIEFELHSIQAWLDTKIVHEVPESLSKLISNFKPFLDAVESSYEQAEVLYDQAQRSLVVSGQEIEERNRLLRSENQKVSNLLNNMRQAVFSVSKGGNIAGPVSKYSETVFNCEITGKTVFDVLYCSLPRDSEDYSALASAMNVVFGESDLQWDLSEESFPKRIILKSPLNADAPLVETNEKILKVACTPIWSEQNLLDKIMFVVEDVTEVEKLERSIALEKAQGSRSLQIIQELISVKRSEIYEFISKSQSELLNFKYNLEINNFEIKDLNVLLQHLHTIKGNARLFGFAILSSEIHRIEALVINLLEHLTNMPTLWNEVKNHIKDPIDQVIYAINEYRNMLFKIFGEENINSESKENLLEIDPSQLVSLKKFIEEQRVSPTAESIEKISLAVERLSDVSLQRELEKYANAVQQLANDLNKEVFLSIDNENCFIDREKVPLLKDAIVHLIRNAIDHGFELPDERRKLGKSKVGLLKVIIKKTASRILIWISDDGYGIDDEIVLRKARAKNLRTDGELASMSRTEIIELIFEPNFSTRDDVSEVSGRGIGMDVVRTNINKLNGTIHIETKVGKGTLFKISIPI